MAVSLIYKMNFRGQTYLVFILMKASLLITTCFLKVIFKGFIFLNSDEMSRLSLKRNVWFVRLGHLSLFP